MVRLNRSAGKGLRRLEEQAGARKTFWNRSPDVGKKVYMPGFTIALVRTTNNSPKYAQFRVPLNFNKFDLRSYLWNLYGVGVLGIRSYIQAQGITRITRDGKGYGPWRRPQSEKRMTVELKVPFVWPEAPKDLAPWEFESWKKAELWQQDQQEKESPKRNKGQEPDHELRNAYKEQAQALLEGKETWRPTWKALGLGANGATDLLNYMPKHTSNLLTKANPAALRATPEAGEPAELGNEKSESAEEESQAAQKKSSQKTRRANDKESRQLLNQNRHKLAKERNMSAYRNATLPQWYSRQRK